jgi:hypothetical protein
VVGAEEVEVAFVVDPDEVEHREDMAEQVFENSVMSNNERFLVS